MSEEPLSPKIEFFSRKRRRKQFYFRIVASNGQTVAASEGYFNRSDAIQTASHLRATLIEARMFDMDKGGEEVL